MNPFFEQQWRDAHTRLIAYITDSLQKELPRDLLARAEEEVVAIGAGGKEQLYRPDVQVLDPDAGDSPEAWTLRETASATEPVRVFMDDEVERWIEIRDRTGRLITVIELLSPSNKQGRSERDRYEKKRDGFMSGGVNVVEIDLVRQGGSIFPKRIRETLSQAKACYGVCVFRASRPVEREVYPIGLRERLPAVRIPLRPTDEDVVLELQPLIDQCHERGRCHFLDYDRELEPLLCGDDAVWMDGLLREAGLR